KLTDSISNVFQFGKLTENLIFFFSLNISLLVISSFIIDWKMLLIKRLNQNADYYLEDMKAHKLMDTPVIYFEDTNNYNLLERISGLGSKCISTFVSLLGLLKNVFILISYLILLVRINWSLGIVLVILIIPSLFIYLKASKDQYLQGFAQSLDVRRAGYLINLFKDREAQQELKIYNHGQFLLDKWKSLYWKTSNDQYKLTKSVTSKKRLFSNLTHLFNTFYFFGLIYFGTHDGMTIGEYIAYSSLFTSSMAGIISLVNDAGSIYGNSFVVEEFYDFVFCSKEKDYIEEASDQYEINLQDEITVKNLSFQYPGQANSVLKDISFSIKAGENGSGKSTLAKCLIGYYEPTSGSVFYDHKKVTKKNANKVWSKLTVLFQNYVKYEFTLVENVLFHRSNSLNDLNKLERQNTFEDYNIISKQLSAGKDSLLGRVYGNGTELSGGQWQKVALTRSLIKEADIFLLDEPTSAMDPLSERKLFDLFFEMCSGKTAIIITHRLANCKKADKIIVLDKGAVVEFGDHASLLESRGVYAAMFTAQKEPFDLNVK
ncbi:ATP-binding cassette domain-containing protein, partial [Paenibacillus odorifer]|uniref:ATP-binding cassette domain-containing protein n=1 Tax=Paenibacillus odorifer TaxID=189426 RepID=UPI00117FCD9F